MNTAAEHNFVLQGGAIATMREGTPYGLIPDAAMVVESGRITWVGPDGKIPSRFNHYTQLPLHGAVVTPALIDCHTHAVFGGNRAREFEKRLQGVSYQEIARTGGGILSTVEQTRRASFDELVKKALPRLKAMRNEGVALVEIKSGYGLDLESERKMLKAARAAGTEAGVTVCTTLLAAHAVPPEYKGRPDAYIDHVCDVMIPTLAREGLVDAVDAFCDKIGFTNAQTRRVFETARTFGLRVKLHAEQLSNQQGAELAAEFRALSADHLEHLSPAGIEAMRAADVAAVLLPGAYYFLRETTPPPIEALRQAGVRMAVATDCNPGTSPMTSLLLAMNMACVQFRMTPEEALAGVTRCAASALGHSDRLGTLEAGKRAAFAVWDVDHPAELSYWAGFNPLRALHQDHHE